jgi:hypothetical protein
MHTRRCSRNLLLHLDVQKNIESFVLDNGNQSTDILYAQGHAFSPVGSLMHPSIMQRLSVWCLTSTNRPGEFNSGRRCRYAFSSTYVGIESQSVHQFLLFDIKPGFTRLSLAPLQDAYILHVDMSDSPNLHIILPDIRATVRSPTT